MPKTIKLFRPSFIEKYFGSFQYLEIKKNNIKIYRQNSKIREILHFKSPRSEVFNFESLEDFPLLNQYSFHASLIFMIPGKKVFVKGLSNDQISRDYQLLIETYSNFFEQKMKNWWKEVKLNTEDEFLRDSMISYLNNIVNSVSIIYKTRKLLINEYFSKSLQNLFTNILKFHPLENHIGQIRYNFEQYNLKLKKEFFEALESYPLTEDQSLSIIRENDKNLILAAAGTGKTSVIVGKALDLVVNKKYEDSDVLILSYSRSASKELNKRIKISEDKLLQKGLISKNNNSSNIQSSTFHSLGRKILIKSKKVFLISKLAEDERFKEAWFEEELQKYIIKNPGSVDKFIDLLTPVSNPLDFKNIGEYEDYLRDNPPVTLSGTTVKGYQELIIANWLYKNGIPYEYESNYGQTEKILLEKPYKPDFRIKNSNIYRNSNIYIEHFGIDRQGNTRSDINKYEYNERIEWAKNIHIKHNTKLIETYHYNWLEGGKTNSEKKHNLEKVLDEKISKYIVKAPKSDEELLENLSKSGKISEFAKILSQSVNAVRIENISIKKAEERLEKSGYTHTKEFIPFLTYLKNTYEKKLRDESTIDFEDMILKAIECIKNGEFKPTWKYILVDEFQDISQLRMDLLNEILKSVHQSSLFTVGDDWQSIYRFSGGKLELTTRYKDLIGSHSLTKLQKTFRYNNSIANVAGRFVMTNPEQYKKEVITHHQVNNSQIHILDTTEESQNSKICQIVQEIKNNNPSASISILSRYNYILNDIKNYINETKKFNNINYWTFHSSKGRESDYCILAGFSQGKLGFPNTNLDYAAVEALLPSIDTYLHSEERRLMYVALTRTKNKSFILANPFEPSDFVDELLVGGYDVVLDSEKFSEKYRKIFKCNFCTYGYLIRSENSYGVYYKCNSFPGCDVIAKSCQKCSAPLEDNNHIRKCKNCENSIVLCRRCNRPMKLRNGKFGEFYGCTGYTIDPPLNCDFTMNLDAN